MPKLKEMDRKTLPSAAIFWQDGFPSASKQRNGLPSQARRAYLLKQHNIAWLNIFNATAAYYYALLGETEEIPEIFRTHTLFSVNILVPGKPMIEMVENQVYLAQQEYAKVIGRSEGLLAVCEAMHYALVALHVQIQTAAAYECLGKRTEPETV